MKLSSKRTRPNFDVLPPNASHAFSFNSIIMMPLQLRSGLRCLRLLQASDQSNPSEKTLSIIREA